MDKNTVDISGKEVKETKLKTYIYMSVSLSGFLTARALILIFGFISALSEYLEYHNDPDDHGGKLHYVDLNAMWLFGVMGIVFAVLDFFVFRWRTGKIRQLDRKIPVIVISVILELFFIPVWGYLILCFSAL